MKMTGARRGNDDEVGKPASLFLMVVKFSCGCATQFSDGTVGCIREAIQFGATISKMEVRYRSVGISDLLPLAIGETDVRGQDPGPPLGGDAI